MLYEATGHELISASGDKWAFKSATITKEIMYPKLIRFDNLIREDFGIGYALEKVCHEYSGSIGDIPKPIIQEYIQTFDFCDETIEFLKRVNKR